MTLMGERFLELYKYPYAKYWFDKAAKNVEKKQSPLRQRIEIGRSKCSIVNRCLLNPIQNIFGLSRS
jgi:hypothetical protein